MALTADKGRIFKLTGQIILNEIPVASATTIYYGAAVSITSGTARNLTVADTADGFAGFATEQVINASGGTKAVKLRSKGIVELAVVGASGVGNVTDPVYATDNDTFTLTSTGGLQIGKVHRWITGTKCEVFFEALTVRSI